jgi:hydroxymethylglutaryl-CoA reductase
LETALGTMFILELLVDVKDSMGANVVDSMTEAVAHLIETLTHGKANLRIVSNLATRRLVHVEAVVAEAMVGGTRVVDRIVEACAFAEKDPLRAATHNKGVMNGVSAVSLAIGNDTRAVEAGAHAYAAVSGQYRSLSTWRKTSEGDLKGTLTMPMAVRIVKGSISIHPTAKIALKILKVRTAREMGEVAAVAGLASNLAALQALVTSGAKSI